MSSLRAFHLAATHLSFQRAAEELGLSPSAVSHQIRGLEARFGVRLFSRSARAVSLTSAGEDYLKTVGAALNQLSLGGQALYNQAGNTSQVLHVSALPYFTSAVILPSLEKLETYHRGLSLRLESTHQYADFDLPGVDVAIRFGREKTSRLRFEPLLTVQSMPVSSAKLAGKVADAADIAKSTLIHVSAQPEAWTNWLSANGLHGAERGGELWVDSVPAALEAAEHGLGFALAMHPLINSREGYGETLIAPFAPTGKGGCFYLVTRAEQVRDKRIAAFEKWLGAAIIDACGGAT